MQTVTHLSGDRIHQRTLPSPQALVSGGTRWGRHEELCTPAYWAAQAWMWELEEPDHYRLGRTLEEELLACLLGGYGIPAEVGLAAYHRLRPHVSAGQSKLRSEEFVKDALTRPIEIGGRQVRYRFANQKARYISAAFRGLNTNADVLTDQALRDFLISLNGVGPKTASWIIRNLRGSDEVAILDVHILRAGRMLGIFPKGMSVERHYAQLEKSFLDFAKAIGTRASMLDSVMWMTMRRLPSRVLGGMIASSGTGQPIKKRKTTEAAIAAVQ